MTAQHDVTVAARVPLELRAELEQARDTAGDADLSVTIRRALRAEADRVLGRAPAGAAGLFAPAKGSARRHDRATSTQAALDVAPRTGSQRRRALAIIEGHGQHGATTDEVIAELEQRAAIEGKSPPAVNGVARRVTDLLQADAITPLTLDGAEATRPTRHGSQAIVYVATEKGRAWLRS